MIYAALRRKFLSVGGGCLRPAVEGMFPPSRATNAARRQARVIILIRALRRGVERSGSRHSNRNYDDCCALLFILAAAPAASPACNCSKITRGITVMK